MNEIEIKKISKSSKYAKKIINEYLFKPLQLAGRKNKKTMHQKLVFAVSSIIHKYDYARQNIILKNKQIKKLKLENKVIKSRLRHLLKSNTIKKYDEWDYHNHKYKLDINELDYINDNKKGKRNWSVN